MENNKQKQINRLQENLSAIRKIAGWTAEELGEKIGVTKQTISNLENKKNPMSLTQYIAIRSILDFEMSTNKENTVLPQVITILLDKADELDEKQYKKVKEAISAVSVSAAGGVARITLATMLAGLLTSIGIGIIAPLGVVVAGTADWLNKILNNKSKK